MAIYDLELKWNGNKLELPETNYMFTIEDSIHTFFPRASIELQDYTAEFREYLVTLAGMGWEIIYGLAGEFTGMPLMVDSDKLSSVTKNRFGGMLDFDLLHAMYNLQTRKSKKHTGKISTIIQQVMGAYGLNKLNIESTGNDDDWFQFYKRDSEFILQNLMPFAFSNSSNESPLYSFIDLKNEFNLVSFNSMFDSTPIGEFAYTGVNTFDEAGKNSILSIEPFRESITSFYELQRRKVVNITKDGKVNVIEDKIEEYPKKNQVLPVIKSDNITGLSMMDDELDYPSSKENIKGQRIQQMKKSMLMDKLIVQTPFNPKIRSGKTIKVVVPSVDDSSVLPIISDKYLIEKCTHVWTGTRGYSKLLLGKKQTKILNSYTFKKDLYGGDSG